MKPARAELPSDEQKRLSQAIDQYFQRVATQRLYVHLDKPMYQPGETMWFRTWELATPSLTHGPSNQGVTVQLISPKGAMVLQKRILIQNEVATNDFELPDSVQGGEYILRVYSDQGSSVERKFIVSTYQPPQIKKSLEFLRKAYGPGDRVSAALALARATGEALAKKQATAIVTIDESEVARLPVTTDAAGNSVVAFELPGRMARGDGLLTILVDDGGVTESIQKRIPIVLDYISFDMFPEGGDLINGLPSRVYFSARNALGKAADVQGRVVDEKGVLVAEFISLHNGMGRFEIEPRAGKSYYAEFTRPTTLEQRIPLPFARDAGCTMMAVDDPSFERTEVRAAVWCTKSQSVIATAVLREKRLGDVAVAVKAGKPTVIALPVPLGSQGAVRMTVLSDSLVPLAERLIYRGLGQNLRVAIKSDRKSYAPRDPVALDIETTDLSGKPVAADLSLAVVDDTVLSFADDKTANILAHVYLESEMPGQEIEEPNFYFSREARAPHAIDLVLGTQGWRRFEWQHVLLPPQPTPDTTTAYDFGDDVVEGALDMPAAEPEAVEAPRARKPALAKKDAVRQPPPPPANAGPMPKQAARRDVAKAEAQERPADRKAPMGRARDIRNRRLEAQRGVAGGAVAAGEEVGDEDWDGADKNINQWAWAPVRQFPAPNYQGRYDGPRVDFRETIYWQPSIKTTGQGKARVSFYLSDSVTSFRATAEGISAGGLPGRAETLIQSKLPVSLAVTMPLEVSSGDKVKLPVTLHNETDRSYDVAVTTTFGKAFRVSGGVPGRVRLDAGERKSFFATLEVIGNGKDPADGKAFIAIDTSNLRDEMSRDIRVVPLGFPQEVSLAGTIENKVSHEVDLAGALPGTIEASLVLYPSPLATMIQGTEALIQEPGGCFEQASSTNYPNIMALGYTEEHNAADPALIARTMGVLDRGYKLLTGYESPKRGYEWFGGDPGHEALTAYGLMEFADMAKVYGDVDGQMIERTKAWLKSRRDGKGGYQRNSRALDSFGSASEEVTNGYITYALSRTGEKDLSRELAYQKNIAASTRDPYVLSLAANTMLRLEPRASESQSALRKLAAMQAKDGSFPGADHSITRSGGEALVIETTALAALAFVQAGQASQPTVRNAIDWMNKHRNGFGAYGSTQSTVLALEAMTAYAEASRATQAGGVVTLLVNGKQAGEQRFEKGQQGSLTFDDVAPYLHRGKNTVELRLDSKITLPYSMAITYRSRMPASSPDSAVAVATTLAKAEVPMGEGVRMKVAVKNVTDKGQPMTLARVGLPGGLAFQTWQLKELRDKKLIDFYETREREVILYFRSMAPKAEKTIDLDLIARVPGSYVAPASQAYLYYTDELKNWAEPVRVTVK